MLTNNVLGQICDHAAGPFRPAHPHGTIRHYAAGELLEELRQRVPLDHEQQDYVVKTAGAAAVGAASMARVLPVPPEAAARLS